MWPVTKFWGSDHITVEPKVIQSNRMTYPKQKGRGYGHVTVLKFCHLLWCSKSCGFVSDSWATCKQLETVTHYECLWTTYLQWEAKLMLQDSSLLIYCYSQSLAMANRYSWGKTLYFPKLIMYTVTKFTMTVIIRFTSRKWKTTTTNKQRDKQLEYPTM